MKQYKTIAGPIGLKAQTGQDYENAVRCYARIIDKEAYGGWALHLIQQIAVKKLVYITVIIGGAIGAVLGAIVGAELIYGLGGVGGFFLGLLIGAGLGCLGLKYQEVLFNMLIFVKDDGNSSHSQNTVDDVKSDHPYNQSTAANDAFLKQFIANTYNEY